MATAQKTSSQFTLTLSDEERALLLNFLEQALREKLVEEHRTDNPDYRQHIEREETLMRGVMDKLRRLGP